MEQKIIETLKVLGATDTAAVSVPDIRFSSSFRTMCEICLLYTSYSKVTESWQDGRTVHVVNEGPFDTAYSVLRYEWLPHKALCGYQKIFLKAGEETTVRF